MKKIFTPNHTGKLNRKTLSTKKAVFLISFLLLMAVSFSFESNSQIIWNAGSKTFIKTSNAQIDTITLSTRIRRGNNKPIYNFACEPDASSAQSNCAWPGPCNTEWAFGTIANWNTYSYAPLWSLLDCPGGNVHNVIVSAPLVCHLISDGIFLQITFNSWNLGGNGRFTYTRTTGPTLPVSISKFTAYSRGNTNVLNWTSSTESNNSHYNIQRSATGTDYITLGNVASKSPDGNSSVDLDYSFSDNHPSPGHNFYRLEQVDKDGAKHYSNVLDLFNSNTGSTIYIVQNPVTNSVNLNISSANASPATVKVFDMNGRMLKTINANIEKGNNILQISMDNLANGLYIIKVYEEANLSFTGKVLKQN